MDTNSGEDTTIAHLFNPEPAAAPSQMATEQPLPPDVSDGYNVPPPAIEPAPVAQPQVPEPPQQVQQPQTQMVPLAELISERRERQEYAQRVRQLEDSMRRLSQPQPQPVPQPQVDPELDPVGAYHQLRNEFSEALRLQNIAYSRTRAAQQHGADKVKEVADAAFQAGLADVFATREDPFSEAFAWYEGEQLRRQIGSDPSAYEQKLRQQITAEILARMKQGTPPPSNLPPSLSTATRANPQGTPEVLGSDKDFFRQTMNPRRG